MKSSIKLLLAATTALTMAACNNNTQTTQAETQVQDTSTTTTSPLQLKDAQQDALLKNYLKLKDALVASNAKEAQQAAQKIASNLKGNAGMELALKMTDSIATSQDLAQQRSTFTNLSNQFIPVFRKAILAKGSFYVQFCPMANEGNGGYWIAAEQAIRNPYYGDEMLNCGEVKETIK